MARVIVILTALLLSLPHIAFSAWTPIIGIPEPAFGINETAPIAPSPWIAGTPGFYYIGGSGATDTSNPYGYPGHPRATIPNPIPAGSVVELHGNFDSGNNTLTSNGTSGSPIFIKGVQGSEPTISYTIYLTATYTIIEHIKNAPSNSSDTEFGLRVVEGSDHVTVRNSEFSGNLNKSGGISVGSWGYTGTKSTSYVLLNNLNIHDIGDINAIEDQDAHGVTLNGSVDNFWLVNSEMARTSGDGIQVEAQQGRRDKINHVYIGKNTSHDNKQTGMWVKHATDVIISQNDIYNHVPSGSSGGAGTGYQYGPEYIWFLYNKIHDNTLGIGVGSNDPPGDGTEAFFIGNLIYNNHNPIDPTNEYEAGCMILRGSTNRYVINNTCYNNDAGINGLASNGKYVIVNNILSNRSQPKQYDINIPYESSAYSIVTNTIFYSPDGIRVNWNGSTQTTLAGFQSYSGTGGGSLVYNPLFVDTSTSNFSLQSSSPAKDAGIVSDVYATFQTLYGLDISVDVTGGDRPFNTLWDIGAYEYGASPPVDPPLLPGLHFGTGSSISFGVGGSGSLGVAE